MRSLILLAFTLALCMAFAATSTDSADTTKLDLASLKLADGGEAVEAHPAGDDTVLEEGVAHDVESSDVGKPEPIAETAPVTHTLDTVNLPEGELDTTPPSAKQSEEVAALDTAAARTYKGVYCPNKCSLYRKYCPRGCYRKYCYIRYRIKYRIKRRYRIKYPVRVRRRYRVKVRYCTKHGYKKHCYYRWVYKYVYVTTYRYKYVYRISYVYKYKYRKGIKCIKH